MLGFKVSKTCKGLPFVQDTIEAMATSRWEVGGRGEVFLAETPSQDSLHVS